MRGTPFPFASPGGGGVNYLDSLATLQDSEARDVRNVVSTTRGAVKKRTGSTSFCVPPVALNSLYASVLPNFLIGAGGTSLYSIDAAGVVTTIAAAQTSGRKWEFVNAPASGGQGPLYAMNGTDTPRQWTGTGNTAVWTATGALPNGTYMVYTGNRVFVAGLTTYAAATDPSSTVVWSDIAAPQTWAAANYLMLDPGDRITVTGVEH